MKNGRVAEVVRESKGEAFVQFSDGSEHHLATHRAVGIANKVDLYPVPSDRAELIALILDRLPGAGRGNLHTALTVEQNNVVMVLDDEHVVIQRRGPNEHGELFDYSPEKVRLLLRRFFDQVSQ